MCSKNILLKRDALTLRPIIVSGNNTSAVSAEPKRPVPTRDMFPLPRHTKKISDVAIFSFGGSMSNMASLRDDGSSLPLVIAESVRTRP
jgi:hypothetical protein